MGFDQLSPQMIDAVFSVLTHKFLFAEGQTSIADPSSSSKS